MRILAAVAAVAAASALGLLVRGAAGQEHILIPGQSATGLIEDPGEVDEIRIFARQGAKVTVTVKAATGSALLPVFTKLEAPTQGDVLPSAVVRGSKAGTSVKLKSFTAPETGTYVLGLSGGQLSTGLYSLTSKVAPSAVVLTGSQGGTIAVAGEQDTLGFDADKSTVLSITVAGIAGGALQPLVTRIERPDAGGSVDLAAVSRKTSKTKDSLRAGPLPDNGTYGLVVTGTAQTTGMYTVTLKPAKVPVLDFTVDPSGPPPAAPGPLGHVRDPGILPDPLGGELHDRDRDELRERLHRGVRPLRRHLRPADDIQQRNPAHGDVRRDRRSGHRDPLGHRHEPRPPERDAAIGPHPQQRPR